MTGVRRASPAAAPSAANIADGGVGAAAPSAADIIDGGVGAAAPSAADIIDGGVGAAASAGAEAGPHPASPTSGGGECRLQSTSVPVDNCRYQSATLPGTSSPSTTLGGL